MTSHTCNRPPNRLVDVLVERLPGSTRLPRDRAPAHDAKANVDGEARLRVVAQLDGARAVERRAIERARRGAHAREPHVRLGARAVGARRAVAEVARQRNVLDPRRATAQL
eukprot:4559219-Prymnesium_polylepis.2